MRDTKTEVLAFWFEEIAPAQWFQKNDSFDQEIKERFFVTYEMAAEGLCREWEKEPDGALALCLVLDQFPRHMFRHDSRSYETDDMALLIAKEAIHKGFDQVLSTRKRRFLYLPFHHSEDAKAQERSVSLYKSMKDDDPLSYDHARRNLDIIQKFGRFPKRNAVLGRESTPEEAEFLQTS
jgi:uncharacterized protein (DUF924 family)